MYKSTLFLEALVQILLTHSRGNYGENLQNAVLYFQDKVVLVFDENHNFPIEAILKHKQVVCMRRRLFTVYKYLILKF